MAFVFESERGELFKGNKATQDVGPGQYLPLTEFRFQNPEIVPFGISSTRQFPEKPSPYPGPGSYYRDFDKEKNEKILNNTVKNYCAKEGEIKIGKKGIAKDEPKKGKQEGIIKKVKNDYEVLGFNSKVKRFQNKNRATTPGPGSYTNNYNFWEAKIIERKCQDNKAIVYKYIQDRYNLFHVDREQMSLLNYNNYSKNRNTKFKNKGKKGAKKSLEEEKKVINKKNNDVKYRVSSIPSKNNKGYIIEESTGKVVRKQNPEAFKIFSGEKDNAVGPGSYEILFPEAWKKTGTSWSKYKWEKEPKKIRPKSSLNVNNINCEVGNFRKKSAQSENNKYNKEMSIYYKSYSTKQLNYKDPTAHNIDTIIEVINKRKMPSFIPVNNVPGPGFYFDDNSLNEIKASPSRPLLEKKPYNSEEELINDFFFSKNGNKEEGNEYDFKKEQAENFKRKIMSKIKQKNIPFLSKSERFTSDIKKTRSFIEKKGSSKRNVNNKNKDSLKGLKIQNNRISDSISGSNELSVYSSTNNSSTNQLIKTIYSHPQSLSGTFYRKDIRFRERQMEENSKRYIPGPGSYINPFTCEGKSNSIQINGRYMDLKTCIKYIEKNRLNNIRPKTATDGTKSNSYIQINKTPGVGSYEPDKIFTVKHEVMNKMKQGNKTFNSTLLSNRTAIYDFQKNAPNGPGTYFQNNNDTVIPENFHGFNATSYRFNKGGKNNTKEILDAISVNKLELNAVISTYMNKENIIKNNLTNLYKNRTKKYKKQVGPGSYDYSSDRYPWIKPSFNSKYA